MSKKYDIAFILPRRSLVPVGGYKIVYEYANELSRRGFSTVVVHGALFALHQERKILTSSSSPFRFRLKHYLAYALSFLQPGPISSRVPWFTREDGVNFHSLNLLSDKNLPPARKYVATSWRTALFLSQTNKPAGSKHYLIQGLETWLDNTDANELVIKTWRSGLNLIVISSWLAKVASSLGLQSKLVPNFVDTEKFASTTEFKQRQERLLFAASDLSVKRLDIAISALEIFKAWDRLDCHAFGAGSRPKRLPDWVTYHRNPSPERLRELYSSSKYFLVSSETEGWCLPALEAMSSGCLVISTRNGGVEEFGSGIVFFSEELTGNALCAALEEAANALPSTAMKHSKLGIEKASSYSVEASVDKLLTALGDFS